MHLFHGSGGVLYHRCTYDTVTQVEGVPLGLTVEPNIWIIVASHLSLASAGVTIQVSLKDEPLQRFSLFR